MNERHIQDLLIKIIRDALGELNLDKAYQENLYLDIPKDNRFGDLSTNIALRLSKLLKQSPTELAANICNYIKKHLENSQVKDYVKEAKVEGAGFINFYFYDRYFYEQLKNIIKNVKDDPRLNIGKKKGVLIEFVSANPTGPLSVAHGRQAAVGDAMANILDFLGFKVKREYYLNDEGNQIDILGKSIELRLKELSAETIEFPVDYYQGE